MLSTIKFFDIMVCVKDDTAEKADEFWPTLVEFLFATKSWWTAVCAEFDLTPAQGQALKVLDPARPMPMSTLAEALLCDASNVTGIVDKLESRGLIARQGSDQDRRVKQLAVTDRGRRIREKLISAIMTPPAAVVALPGDVKIRVAQLLRALLSDRGMSR